MPKKHTEDAVAFLRTNSQLIKNRVGLRWASERIADIATLLEELQIENDRLRAALHKARGEVTVGEIRIDIGRQEAFYRDEEITLTRIEFMILEILARTPDVRVPTQVLCDEIWGQGSEECIDTLRVHISHLRRKIDDGEGGRRVIATIPTAGYMLCTAHEGEAC